MNTRDYFHRRRSIERVESTLTSSTSKCKFHRHTLAPSHPMEKFLIGRFADGKFLNQAIAKARNLRTTAGKRTRSTRSSYKPEFEFCPVNGVTRCQSKKSSFVIYLCSFEFSTVQRARIRHARSSHTHKYICRGR